MKNRDIPKGEKAVYTRLVVDLIPNKALHESYKYAWGVKNGKRNGHNNDNGRPHQMQNPHEWSGINAGHEVRRRRRQGFSSKHTTEEKEILKSESKINSGGNDQKTQFKTIY